jgi:hypothetical protein
VGKLANVLVAQIYWLYLKPSDMPDELLGYASLTQPTRPITADETMGLQFGETLVVKKNGCESLNRYPREWVVCNG